MAKPQSIRHRTIVGAVWVLGQQLTTIVLQVAFTVVAARLLQPADSGIIALGQIVLRLVSYFSQMGISAAIVQRSALNDTLLRQAKCYSIIGGSCAYVLVFFSAPVIAEILGQPAFESTVRLLGLDILISCASFVALGVLRREMRFKELALVEVISYAVAYIAVGIAAILTIGGSEALVIAALCQSVIRTTVVNILARINPIAMPMPGGDSQLLRFGSNVSAIGFLEFWSSNLDSAAVGRFLGPSALGEYSRASTLVWLPAQQVSNVLGRVFAPGLARASKARASELVLQGTAATAAFLIPLSAVLAVASPTILLVLLGEGWDDAKRIAPLLSVAAAINALSRLPAVLCEAHQVLKPKLVLQAGQLALLIALVAVLAVTHRGLLGYATAWLISEIVRHCGYLYLLRRYFGQRARCYIRSYAETLPMSTAAVLGVVPILLIWPRTQLPAVLGLGLALLTASAFIGVFLRYNRQSIQGRLLASEELYPHIPQLVKTMLAMAKVGVK